MSSPSEHVAPPPHPEQASRGKGGRRWWRWLVILLLVVGNCALAEFIAASRLPVEVRLYREHPRRFWTLNPGGWRSDEQAHEQVYISSLGIRSQEAEPARPDLVVLLLGDSCTYGAGVRSADTIDRHLERRLRQVTGKSVRVYNGGCPGYSTYQGLDLLHDIGGTLKPDIVVLAYLYGDGRQDICEDRQRAGGPWAATARTLLWKSAVYRLLRQHLRSSEDDYVRFLHTDLRGMKICRVSMGDYARNLRELAKVARDQGARNVVFLNLPCRNPDSLRSGNGAPAVPGGGGHTGHVGVLFATGAQEGVVVDGEELWRDRSERGNLFWDPIHFTEAGCRALGEDLADALVDRGMVTRGEK